MKKKVTITDDTFRRNVAVEVTEQIRLDYNLANPDKPLPNGVKFLFSHDQSGKHIQETVNVDYVFEGKHLHNAVLRAKRWLRSGKFPGRAPRHIALALAAFHKADPKAFNKMAAGAVT